MSDSTINPRHGMYSNDNFVICDFSEVLWSSFKEQKEYSPKSLWEEGFVHCANPSQVSYVINKFFQEDSYRILVMDKVKLGDKLVYEGKSVDNKFPHLYRPIYFADVIDSWTIQRDSKGEYQLPIEFISSI